MSFVFIDESGDLGDKGSTYLILAALILEDLNLLNRGIKNMRRNKFRKQLVNASEIKANKSSKEVIIHLIQLINLDKNAKILFVVLDKKRIFSPYLKENKHKLYNYVSGKIANNLKLNSKEIKIIIDKSKGKQLLQQDFNNYFLMNMNKTNETKISISHSYSHNWAGLQFADCLAWACFQKFEHKNDYYLTLIKVDTEIYQLWK